MYVADDDSSSSVSGYTTPPLSPTKTISTEGWSSPRTPGSPRKSRSCLFYRDIDHELESSLFTPPHSPTKLKFASRLGALSIPEVFSPTCAPESPSSIDDSPVKRNVQSVDQSSPRRSLNVARSNNRSLPDTVIHSHTTIPVTTPSLDIPKASQNYRVSNKRRSSHRCSSESSIEALVAKYATPPTSPAGLRSAIDRDDYVTDDEVRLPAKLGRYTPRSSNSPLRPSQWVSRGGILSPPRKSQTSTPDRFIHSRRPPAGTREIYELNKPNERAQISRRGHRAGGDPFSRRMRRSDRLNAELRSLREAHTVITGRPGGNIRSSNPGIRSSSLVASARQISAGAVWHVGGPSLMSNTIAAVSIGNGGMLGSGTTAPLYVSSFLNRADPEAELEAYERRLALAVEVNQTDRILHHSTPPTGHLRARHSNAHPHTPHFWMNGAWTQEILKACLSYDLSKIPQSLC